MREYESPKAEFLELNDVITASAPAEPCSCYALDKPGEVCKATPQTAVYSTAPGRI